MPFLWRHIRAYLVIVAALLGWWIYMAVKVDSIWSIMAIVHLVVGLVLLFPFSAPEDFFWGNDDWT